MTTRRIFISDIHMGDERSAKQVAPYHNYCWFYDQSPSSIGNRPAMLAAFLNKYCIVDTSVKEVVILGDLFDAWVCPSEFDPTDPSHPIPPLGQQFVNISSSIQNKAVIAAFQELASQGRLKYVPGNHDMLAEKAIMEQMFPGIDYVTSPDGHAVYRGDGIWAEHGHWYGLFNAPFPASHDKAFNGSLLPLGYFISRIASESALKTGKQFGFTEIFQKWLEHILTRVPAAKDGKDHDRNIVDALLTELLNTMISDYATERGALMNGVCGIPGWLDWQEVKDRYATIYSEWENGHANNVGNIDAIRCDAGDLWPAARLVFFQHEDAKIIIFGHTHGCLITSNLEPDSPGTIPLSGKKPVYVNSGAWCNDTSPCTFIETEFDAATENHVVQPRVWAQDPATGKYVPRDVDHGQFVSLSGGSGTPVVQA